MPLKIQSNRFKNIKSTPQVQQVPAVVSMKPKQIKTLAISDLPKKSKAKAKKKGKKIKKPRYKRPNKQAREIQKHIFCTNQESKDEEVKANASGNDCEELWDKMQQETFQIT